MQPVVLAVQDRLPEGEAQLNNAWNGGAALSDPDILRAVHEDYIQNGADNNIQHIC
mgnify:CR=1 FL=1